MLKKIVFLMGMGVLANTGLYAADINASEIYKHCMNAAESTTAMQGCIGAETKRQDTRLNHAYLAKRAGMDATRQKQLQEVQRAWIRFRDANCAYYANPKGGSNANVNASLCLMQMTAIRADELENFERAY